VLPVKLGFSKEGELMKSISITLSVLVGLGLAATVGCSASSAGFTALSMGKNLSDKDSHLITYIDGQEAKQNKIKKAAMGHAQFKVKGTVGTSPSFKFEWDEDVETGRIRTTNILVYKEFEKDYSGSPEFTIMPVSNDPSGQFQPGTLYNLGAPGAGFRVTDFYGKQVNGITLEPGKEYMFLFSVSGDHSETIQVFFDTK
jgi:hypothetical protein